MLRITFLKFRFGTPYMIVFGYWMLFSWMNTLCTLVISGLVLCRYPSSIHLVLCCVWNRAFEYSALVLFWNCYYRKIGQALFTVVFFNLKAKNYTIDLQMLIYFKLIKVKNVRELIFSRQLEPFLILAHILFHQSYN